MKTSIIMTIEHPEGTSAEQFIDTALSPIINDINADSEEGWKVYTDDLSAITKVFEDIDPNSEEGQDLEDIARSLIRSLQSHFKMIGVMWDRSSAEYVIGRELTDEEWQKVWSTDEWQALGHGSDADSYCIEEALASAGVEE